LLRYLVLLLFLTGFVLSSLGQKPFNVRSSNVNQRVSISDQSIRIVTGKKEFNFPADTVLLNEEATIANAKHSINSSYIAKIMLKNENKNSFQAIMQLAGARNADVVKALVMHKNGRCDTILSGRYLKNSVKYDYYDIEAKIPVYLLPGEQITYYFHVKNISGFSPEFKPKLVSLKAYYSDLIMRNWIQGLLIGALLLMIAYNLLVFVQSRDKTYLFYSLYIFTIALNFFTVKGLLSEFIFGEYPKLIPYFFAFSASMIFAFYVQFVRNFINTRQLYPKWDVAHRSVIAIKVTIFGLQAIGLFFTFNVAFVTYFNNLFNLVELVYGVLFMLTLYRKKDNLAFYLISGTIFLIAGSLVSIVLLLFNIDLGFDPKYFMNVGSLVEILFFSLGLGYKMKLTEKEKQEAQEMLILQLQQNEILQMEHNRDLEQKVKTRTFEIEQQKEEITTQRDEIEAQRDLAQAQSTQILIQNKKITDSIVYARQIQAAMLPTDLQFNRLFDDYFVIYKPRDIVSGDFYRLYAKENKIAIAVGDATGHGVPGAFMSLLGMSYLNEIYSGSGLKISPAEVLDSLKTSIIGALSQTGNVNETKDGFDIAVCVIDKSTMELQYAGANHPVHIARNGEILTLKPDRMPVGIYYRENKGFSNRVFKLLPNDVIYMYSDGFVDQPGGERGRKFLRKNFVEMLQHISNLPLPAQNEHVLNRLYEWQGNTYEQIDDIIVLAVKV